ncbi:MULTISPECIES: hypothetical protein [unclassified Microbacterium]|uniref:hypothetical protein n=1 Tax=unclassified Microbacterium TaxID=2609290 RepID=UPI0024686B6E|nr:MULTISPECIES: hypothetical protein [unclassified Microbacterium]MDH5132862.1 hypothetical protein [Microbacterium sp. RD10]MDH5136421.1 hypothetical protein [Microbacterium sp. RD11]MDH5145113.1 hypothetical protein [Microbacterium sp. RD12]MDH5154810.1 hypothetical protein [Microbacterium sp. RD06]MDH5164928.1 hypothetical protein [Microbacterium sp. RD02]
MTDFICDLCDRPGTHDHSMADTPTEDEVCASCRRGLGLATFYEDDMLLGAQRVEAPGGSFPERFEWRGREFTLEDSDRMTATYRT